MARPHTRVRVLWTDDELALLRELYPVSAEAARAALPGRGKEAIRVHARKMGLQVGRRYIGKELLAALEEGPGTAEELAAEIEHPGASVSARLGQMFDAGLIAREDVKGAHGTRYLYSLKED